MGRRFKAATDELNTSCNERSEKGIIWKKEITKDINIPDTVLLSVFMSSNYKLDAAHALQQILK